MDATTIGIICTIVGGIIGFVGYKRAATKDIQMETREGAIMATKLDASATSSDKESETNTKTDDSSNVQVSTVTSTDTTTNSTVDVATIQAQNDALKLQVASIQLEVAGTIVQA